MYKLKFALDKAHELPVSTGKVSPDGTLLATASTDKTIKLWKLQPDGATYWKTLAGHTKGISSVEFSPNSRFLASASDDLTIRIWDLDLAETIQILRGHTYHVTVLKFHHRGSILASGSADENIRIWDLRRAKCMKVLSAHSDPISSLDFSFDGTVIVSGSYDGLIRLFDLETGQCLKTLIYDKSGSSYPVSHVAFSPNSRYISSSSLDGFIRLWDYMNNKVVKTFQNVNGSSVAEKYCLSTGFVTCFEKPLICSGDERGKVLFWDIQSKEIVLQLDTGSHSPVMEVEPISNGKRLMTLSYLAAGSASSAGASSAGAASSAPSSTGAASSAGVSSFLVLLLSLLEIDSNRISAFLQFLRLFLANLLWEQVSVDVWQNTTLSDGHMTEQLVQFLIVSDGQLQVSWDNSALLVVSSSVTGQFQNFGSQVFQNSSQVDWGTGTNSLSVVTVSEQSVDSSDWEGQSSLGRS